MPIDHSTATTPKSTTSGSTLLFDPSTLPTCAQACVLNYIEGFNCDTDDLSCLCSEYSREGYTLGETALVCLEQQCSKPSDSQRYVYEWYRSLSNALVCGGLFGRCDARRAQLYHLLTVQDTGTRFSTIADTPLFVEAMLITSVSATVSQWYRHTLCS